MCLFHERDATYSSFKMFPETYTVRHLFVRRHKGIFSTYPILTKTDSVHQHRSCISLFQLHDNITGGKYIIFPARSICRIVGIPLLVCVLGQNGLQRAYHY